MGLAYPFVPGWDQELAYRGKMRFLARGRRLFTGAQFAKDDRPLPPGFSLGGWIKWAYNQLQVGSCFSNMGAHVLQIMLQVAVANGAIKPAYSPSRKLIWYQCRKLDGSLGKAADGGSIVNTFAAIGDAPDGVGDVPDPEWPYAAPDDWMAQYPRNDNGISRALHNWLEQTPPASVITDAGNTRISQIAEMKFDPTAFKRSIFNGSPIGIGITWPEGWDENVDSTGRVQGIGFQKGGHAITIIGWVDGWDGHTWYEIQNSHGPIYSPVPSDIQAKITGYAQVGLTDGKVFDFWVREDWLQKVLSQRFAEAYNAAGVEGYEPVQKNVPSFSDGFVV